MSRTNDDSGESPLGNLIADAQKNDTSAVTGGKTPEIAFMNPGGIRADLASTGGSVTYGQAFSVQPFNNYDVSMDMTGSQILSLLDQQWSGTNAASPKILQVSGITYSYSKSGTTYTLKPETVQVNGAALDKARTYRVVANSFLSDGGDGFAAFAGGGEQVLRRPRHRRVLAAPRGARPVHPGRHRPDHRRPLIQGAARRGAPRSHAGCPSSVVRVVRRRCWTCRRSGRRPPRCAGRPARARRGPRRQREGRGADVLLEVLHALRARDRGHVVALREHPGQRQLAGRRALALRDLTDPGDQRQVGVERVAGEPREVRRPARVVLGEVVGRR